MKQPEEMFDIDKQEIFDVNKLVLSIDTYKKNPRDVKALWALHYYYKNGWCDVIKDPDKTIACLKIAAKHGHAGASYELIRYSSKFNDEDSISLVRLYTNNEHIQKCFDKSDECNDPPYYNQQPYIGLLGNFRSQIQQTDNDHKTTNLGTITHRIGRRSPSSPLF